MPWFADSRGVSEILAEWTACSEVGWSRSLNVEESCVVLATLAEATEIVERCAANTTAADLAQEIEFLKAEGSAREQAANDAARMFRDAFGRNP